MKLYHDVIVLHANYILKERFTEKKSCSQDASSVQTANRTTESLRSRLVLFDFKEDNLPHPGCFHGDMTGLFFALLEALPQPERS